MFREFQSLHRETERSERSWLGRANATDFDGLVGHFLGSAALHRLAGLRLVIGPPTTALRLLNLKDRDTLLGIDDAEARGDSDQVERLHFARADASWAIGRMDAYREFVLAYSKLPTGAVGSRFFPMLASRWARAGTTHGRTEWLERLVVPINSDGSSSTEEARVGALCFEDDCARTMFWLRDFEAARGHAQRAVDLLEGRTGKRGAGFSDSQVLSLRCSGLIALCEELLTPGSRPDAPRLVRRAVVRAARDLSLDLEELTLMHWIAVEHTEPESQYATAIRQTFPWLLHAIRVDSALPGSTLPA